MTIQTSNDPAALYFVPAAEWIISLKVGDMAPNCFGQMAEITRISAQRDNIKGVPFICLYTKLSETSQMSGSFTAGQLHRSLSITGRHTSHELDTIEKGL